jgi:hypothetical protein
MTAAGRLWCDSAPSRSYPYHASILQDGQESEGCLWYLIRSVERSGRPEYRDEVALEDPAGGCLSFVQPQNRPILLAHHQRQRAISKADTRASRFTDVPHPRRREADSAAGSSPSAESGACHPPRSYLVVHSPLGSVY